MRLLIKSNAGINKINERGSSSLITAAYFGRMATVRLLVEAGADSMIRCNVNKNAAEWAKEMKNDAVVEYLIKDAPKIRFHSSAWDVCGQLHLVKGRSLRAIQRDLKERDAFVNHILFRLQHFCIGKRS